MSTTHEPSAVNDEDDEYISGKDFPELLNQCQDWKRITIKDFENCKYSYLANIDPLVKSKSEEFLKDEQIRFVSMEMTKDDRRKFAKAASTLMELVAEGSCEANIFGSKTLPTECARGRSH